MLEFGKRSAFPIVGEDSNTFRGATSEEPRYSAEMLYVSGRMNEET